MRHRHQRTAVLPRIRDAWLARAMRSRSGIFDYVTKLANCRAFRSPAPFPAHCDAAAAV